MNILYIAYSCNPYAGSEDKIGWCVPLESSKNNKVIVVTKEEQRTPITDYLNRHSLNNIEFLYVDIPEIYKKLFKGVWYSGRLNIWNRKAFPVVKKICADKKIDIVHQITPIEFRAIGKYGKIENIKFVCGPLGGGEYVPRGVKCYTKGHRFVENTRTMINYFYRFFLKVSGNIRRCDYILFANRETREFLDIKDRSDFTSLVFDNGLRNEELTISNNRDEKVFLSTGRMIYRKGYEFLLDALLKIPKELDYKLRIVGDGPEFEKLSNRCSKDDYLSKHVSFVGAIPYSEIEREYLTASVFIMPSIRETTGTVLLEAMSKGLPVIALNRFGAATILDDSTAWLIDGYDKDSFACNLAGAIIECISNPDEVKRRGENARQNANNYTWEKKNIDYQRIYESLLNN